MSVEHERLKQILAEAAGKDTPEARAAYLDAACQGDAQLRAKVERLLQAHELAGDFLEQSVLPPAEDPVGESPGTIIGRYKLLEEIGAGGFGLVFMAEQTEPVQRKVALKIIKAGMDTREVIARFEAERQALALMDHPNISKVLDAGATESGRPYFVMELVNGIPITDYCDQEQLSTAERLQLFMKVCHAVQHAHQKGIIHRDLKPTNILVTVIDGEAVPKVIDFGVAKALGQKLTQRTLFTSFQQMIGTPAYMSPEQAALSGVDVDTRSDIYSLGVLLYELLTGVTPFDQETLRKAALDEIRRLIRETEPPKPSTRLQALVAADVRRLKSSNSQPSTLNSQPADGASSRRLLQIKETIRLVRGDLDWIVMKALEKDRARRYETASSLLEDIQRHLDQQPVQASPPSATYRARKFVRRHRMGVALAASVTAALIAGLAVSLVAFAQTRRERDRALAAEQRAEANEQKAQIEAARSAQVAQFLKDMLQGVGPSVAIGRDTTMLREILDQTAARVGKDLQNQPEVEADLRRTLGWVYFDLGDDFVAETFQRDALALRRKLHGNQHPEVADSLHGLGHALWRQGKLADAETAQREALTIRRKTLGNDDLDTARSLNDLALVLYSQGKLIEAEAICREALSTRRKFLREPHVDVAHSLHLLAMTLGDQGKLVEAETLHREALAMRRKLYGNKHPYVAFSLGALGAVLAREERYPEAESLLYESVAMQRELLCSNHPDSLMSLYTLAKLLAREGKLAEAAELCHKEAGSGPAVIFNSIAWPLATCIHAPVRDGETAVSFAEKAVTATSRKDAICLDTLAAAYAEVGQFTKAVSTVKEAIALLPDGRLKEDCGLRLKLYESNSPYRERVYENNLR